jgi:DNA primase
MAEWPYFKKLRESLSFEAVIRHYGVEVRPARQGQHNGPCPLPQHRSRNDASSFSANFEKGVFQCSGCGAKGTVLEFAAMMERVDPRNGEKLRPVAVKLACHFDVRLDEEPRGERAFKPRPRQPDLPVVVNAPLDFELKGLDQAHPFLRSKGFTAETVHEFGLGVAARGLLKGRLAIPLHHDGKLVGYAGRDVANSDGTPKYLFPSQRERGGVIHRFDRSRFLYNGCFIKGPVDDLVVVMGFADVWWLHQHGRPNVVSTMGDGCSGEQSRLIVSLVRPAGRIWIMPDGTSQGERHALSVLKLVSPSRFVRWIQIGASKRPVDLNHSQLQSCFRS